jgi:diamine N-acetyltransferase
MHLISMTETIHDRSGQAFVARDFESADRARLIAMYGNFEPKRSAQGLPPIGEPKIAQWLDRVLARGRHLVVEFEMKVIGHVMLMPMEEESVELANFLHQSVRGRGIGTALNALAIRLAREAGHQRVWLSVEPGNRAAVRSYEKVGFRRLPGSYWAPEVEMAVELVAAT